MYPYYRYKKPASVPWWRLKRNGGYHMVLHEVKPGWTITKEWEGYTSEADVAFSQIKEEEYLGILFRRPSA